LPTPTIATRTAPFDRPRPLEEPFVAAIASFRVEGTPSARERARTMTSLTGAPVRRASAWIRSLSAGGMRSRITGLAPGSGLFRPVGR
jgi:hypothetical protein